MPQDKLHRPLHDLRISVIDRCNFRCPYCMPGATFPDHYRFLSPKEWLSFDEIERLARIFVALGVSKLRLTGGEPLTRPDLPRLVQRLSVINGIEDLALTTNGAYLGAFAADLKTSGLGRLTVSLDALHPKTFRRMSGDRGDVHVVLKGIEMAQESGFQKIRINCVIKRGMNEAEILPLTEYCFSRGLVLRFIEYMDVGTLNAWQPQDVVSSIEIREILRKVYTLSPLPRHQASDTSERFAVDGQGEIGFVSSVSHPFCGECSRLRLSADGKIYTCLFAREGLDLREHLRNGASDEQLSSLIVSAWQGREDRYSELRSQWRKGQEQIPKVEMFHIGG